MCESLESVVEEYFNQKWIEVRTFNWFEDTQSFQMTGLTEGGDGCYMIGFGDIRDGQIRNFHCQYFKELNQFNIEESCGFSKKL